MKIKIDSGNIVSMVAALAITAGTAFAMNNAVASAHVMAVKISPPSKVQYQRANGHEQNFKYDASGSVTITAKRTSLMTLSANPTESEIVIAKAL